MKSLNLVLGFLALLALAAIGPAFPASDPLLQGEALLADERYAEARRAVEGVLEREPAHPRANYLLGRIDLATGELDGAIRHLELAVEGELGNIDYHLGLADAYGEKFLRARFLGIPKWARRWRNELERTFELAPQHVGARRRLIRYYLHAPGIGGGNKKKATRLAEETIELDEVEGRLLLAHAYKDTDRTGEAVREYEAVLALEPTNGAAHRGLGGLYLDDGDWKSAEEWFRRALELDPDDAESRFRLAHIYEEAGKKPEAVAEYETLVRRTPHHEHAPDARKRLEALR